MNRKSIFVNKWKIKIGHTFSYEDLKEFKVIIDFYEKIIERLKSDKYE